MAWMSLAARGNCASCNSSATGALPEQTTRFCRENDHGDQEDSQDQGYVREGQEGACARGGSDVGGDAGSGEHDPEAEEDEEGDNAQGTQAEEAQRAERGR